MSDFPVTTKAALLLRQNPYHSGKKVVFETLLFSSFMNRMKKPLSAESSGSPASARLKISDKW
jgi:hypothetical protein